MAEPAPGHIFRFPPTLRLHDTRTRRIRAILRPDQAPSDPDVVFTAWDHCLAHHALEGAEAAARAADAATFNWYCAHPDANAPAHSVPTDAGPRVIREPRH